MLPVDVHECPICGGAIAREHTAMVRDRYSTDLWLHCAFCGVGWEASQFRDGTMIAVDYQRRTEPQQFHRFLARLEEAQIA